MGRSRRTKTEMVGLRDAIYSICGQYQPVTVRQVFYQLVARGLIEKTQSEYANAVSRVMGQMRRDGSLPFSWVAANTRWVRKPNTYDGMTDMLEGIDRQYRRDLWTQADVEVKIWLEKEALAGVLYDVTEEFDVALMVTRGYPSISFTYAAARQLGRASKTYIYYFGDLERSALPMLSELTSR